MALIKLPPFQNVGANQTAVMPALPLGMTYNKIILKLGGTFTKAQITGIRSRLAGKQFVDITGSHLDTVNKWFGRTDNASYLSLHFADPNARTVVGEAIGAIDTSVSGIGPFELEVDIGAATNPTLEAWADVSAPKSLQGPQIAPYRDIMRAMLKATHSIGAAGEFNLTIPQGSVGGALINRIHYLHTNLTKVQVTRDGVWMQQEGENALVGFAQDEVNRAAQSGHVAWDPVYRDNQSDAVNTLRDNGQLATIEHKATASASDTVVTYSDLYSTISRI